MLKINPEEFKDWNERMITKYDPDAFHHHSNPFIRFVEKRRVKTIFNMMTIQPEDSVLEVGCGAGNVIERASSGKLFGVDLSTSILRKAKRQINRNILLFQGDAQNLPCKNQGFQHVICSEVLEHVLDPLSVLSEISRILTPRGVAILSIPNESWINGIKRILIRLRIFNLFMDRQGGYQQMPERMDEEWHLHSFRLGEWLNMVTRFFRVTRLKRVPFTWLPLRYVIRLQKQ